jgi:hypothetical protein
MSKRFLISFVVGLVLMVVGSVGASRLNQKDKGQGEFQAELEGATPVQVGALTERQRIHSKLYSDFRQDDGQTIVQLIAAYKERKVVYRISVEVNTPRLSAEVEAPETFFGNLAQQSDAVILGRVTNKVSQITQDGRFIFTDYDVMIKEALKGHASPQLAAGTTINVTCPGGKVLIGNTIVKTGGNSIASLPLNNHDVVLFVKALPQAGDFKLARYDASFELGDVSVTALAGMFPSTYLVDKHSFLETVRAAVTK